MTQKNSLEHLPGLDVVRGVAIIWVLLHHTLKIKASSSFPLLGEWLSSYIIEFVTHGWLGVNLFFVLSGFLITRILLSTLKSDRYFSNFYVRRALRIFPLYYGLLILAFFMVCLPVCHYHFVHWAGAARLWSDQIWYWTFLVNVKIFLTNSWQSDYFNHTWTLAVEEQFYLFWPFLCWLLAPRKLAWLCLGIVFLCPAIRIFLAWHGASFVVLRSFTLAQIDSFAFGAFLCKFKVSDFGSAAEE